jgi:hypothetical protein
MMHDKKESGLPIKSAFARLDSQILDEEGSSPSRYESKKVKIDINDNYDEEEFDGNFHDYSP